MPRHNETAKVERYRQHETNHEFDRRRLILHTCIINVTKVINSLCRRHFDDLQVVQQATQTFPTLNLTRIF